MDLDKTLSRFRNVPGIIAARIVTPTGSASTDGSWDPVATSCASLLDKSVAAEVCQASSPIRVHLGLRTMNLLRLGGTDVAVLTETGHPIHKSLRRMVSRILASAARSPSPAA